MGQATRMTLDDARRWARWQTDRERVSHSIYQLTPAGEAHGLDAIRAVLPRFVVRPEGMPAPDGGNLVATLTPRIARTRAEDARED